MFERKFKADQLSVLIVDDFSTMRRIIKNMLKDMGFDYTKIDETSDGQDAYPKIIKSSYDIILTDWNMPNMDGLTLVKKLRSNHVDIPIIMITAEAKRENIIEAANAGASSYIIKPFSFETFCAKMNKVVANHYNYLCL